MDFMIYLHNLVDRESENQKDICALELPSLNNGQSWVNFENFFFFFLSVAKVRSQDVHIDYFHFL